MMHVIVHYGVVVRGCDAFAPPGLCIMHDIYVVSFAAMLLPANGEVFAGRTPLHHHQKHHHHHRTNNNNKNNKMVSNFTINNNININSINLNINTYFNNINDNNHNNTNSKSQLVEHTFNNTVSSTKIFLLTVTVNNKNNSKTSNKQQKDNTDRIEISF
jgi:hypothetical protein